jgi:hypothetical protein
VAESVDATDLKSVESDLIPVRVRARAPAIHSCARGDEKSRSEWAKRLRRRVGAWDSGKDYHCYSPSAATYWSATARSYTLEKLVGQFDLGQRSLLFIYVGLEQRPISYTYRRSAPLGSSDQSGVFIEKGTILTCGRASLWERRRRARNPSIPQASVPGSIVSRRQQAARSARRWPVPGTAGN